MNIRKNTIAKKLLFDSISHKKKSKLEIKRSELLEFGGKEGLKY